MNLGGGNGERDMLNLEKLLELIAAANAAPMLAKGAAIEAVAKEAIAQLSIVSVECGLLVQRVDELETKLLALAGGPKL